MSDTYLELRNVSKRFSGVQALDRISLSIMPGEIHCLAGENGSGKSTVIKVISGVYQPDEGEILIDGQPFVAASPLDAIKSGVQVIYQDFSLFGNLSVAENLSINTQLRNKQIWVNWKKSRQLASEALQRLGVDIDLDAKIDSLPTAQKQLIAIARSLMTDVRLIIMDEPTSALTGKEIARLFEIVRDIQSRGIAFLFVSHKIREMLDISERITVIRNGRKIVDGPTGEFTEALITKHMTGHDIQSDHFVWKAEAAPAAPRLEVRDLTLPGYYENLNFKIFPGEIVGISSILGSGRTEFALSLFGLITGFSGDIHLNGQAVDIRTVHDAIDNHIAYVPADRLSEGVFPTQSINRNLLSTMYERISRHSVIDRETATRMASEMIEKLAIATPSGEQPVNQLSGGNAQRVVIGRWLMTGAEVLILNGPTVGVDVGSKAEIHKIIRALTRKTNGLSVIMISDDVPELIQNCNRIVMMHKGRFVEELVATQTSEDEINAKLKSFG
jgi:simple sugar transport system ATP-binding protein